MNSPPSRRWAASTRRCRLTCPLPATFPDSRRSRSSRCAWVRDSEQEMSFNLTRSRRWRIHDHTRVHAPRERTEAVSRRYESTQASRTSTPAGRRRRRPASPSLPFKVGWKEGAASRPCSISRSSPTVRSRRPGELGWFHFVDVTRVHLTTTWVVCFSILGPFGQRRSAQVKRARRSATSASSCPTTTSSSRSR